MSLPRHLPPVEPDLGLLALFERAERIPAAVRRQAAFFVFFARAIFPLLESYRIRLSAVYCQDNGRPAWDPVRLLGVLILQFVLKVADRQAAEAVQYDQRWRLALHLDEHDAAFDPSLLVVFRNRLLEKGQEALAFEAILDYLVEHGWVPKRSRQPGEPTVNFLTAIVTQDAPASDKAGMAQVLKEQRNMGLDAPSSLYVDGAYVSSEGLQQAEIEGRELRGPAPASPDRGKVFTVEAFDVHVEERYALCPAGQRSTNCSRVEEARGPIIFRIEWNNTLCGSCQKRADCLSGNQTHRTICVNHLYSYLQARRREMQTDAFKQEMRRRNGIEGTQSELVRGYGLRHARYRGKAKVRLQNYLIGAACNIRRLFRRIEWLTLQTLKVSETAVVAIPA